MSNAPVFFKEVGYPCKDNYNPADHYIWELSVIEGKEEECETKIKSICSSYSESSIYKSFKAEKREKNTQLVTDKINEYDENKVGFFVSLYWLLWRSLISQYRDKATVGMKFGQNLGTALIVGLVYLRVPWGNTLV